MDNQKHFTVKELPDTMKPYEKFESMGPASLTDAELLSIIIRCGTVNLRSIQLAENILCHNNGGLMNLHYLTQKELTGFAGIGKVKAIQLKCIAELTKRMAKTCRYMGECFQTPDYAATYYMEDMRNLEREQLVLLMLDSKSRRIHDMVISSGSVNSSIVSTRDIFYQSLKYGAVNIILLHNHPSGDPSPSREDISVTKKVVEAGEIVGIRLLDHIIIGDNCYFSMKQQNYI